MMAPSVVISILPVLLLLLFQTCNAVFQQNNNQKVSICESIPGRENHTSYW
jgi:hypothetical protein